MTPENTWHIGPAEVAGNTLTCLISGERPGGFELRFETEGDFKPTPDDGTAALITALVPAMRYGADITCDSPVDPLLLRRIPGIQRILTTWYPARLKSVKITATPGPFRLPKAATSATFFSGGVDSWHSLIGNLGVLTHAILVTGFDFREKQDRLAEEIRTRLAPAVESYGVRLTGVKTNLREFTEPHAGWGEEQHGAALAAAAAVLSPYFGRVVIPGSYQFTRLEPWGSHPVLDSLWSTSAASLSYFGVEATRPQKIESLLNEPTALRHLRVCYENPADEYNCGTCAKCLVTMIAWKLSDPDAKFPSFARPLSVESVRRHRITIDTMEEAFRHRLAFIRQAGDTRPDLIPYGDAIKNILLRRTWAKRFAKLGLRRLRRMMER